jgi:hypothetical protein
MNDELYGLKNLKDNKKKNEIKCNSNNDSYSLNQYNKWINAGNKEENVNPIINNKSKYVLTCYGNWLGVKNYNEKTSYYIKDSNTSNNIEIDYSGYDLTKLKIYSLIVLDIFNKYFQYYKIFQYSYM